MLASTIIFGSCLRANSMAATSSASDFTLEIPTLDPARLGFTNTGSPSNLIRIKLASRWEVHCAFVTTSYGPTGIPADCIMALRCALSIAAALAKTPEPT